MTRRSLLKPPGARMSARERQIAYATMSAVLRYPDEALICDLPLLASAIGKLPEAVADPLRRLIAHLASAPLLELQAAYVATFDMRRRCCLYLSYYLNGDTRRRGEALWRFQDAYRQAGFQVAGRELPDFLPMLLELAASGAEAPGVALMQEHREGIRVLASALGERRSPYAESVRALEAVLPAARTGTAANAARLAREGPPAELVGLDPSLAFEPYPRPDAAKTGSEAP